LAAKILRFNVKRFWLGYPKGAVMLIFFLHHCTLEIVLGLPWRWINSAELSTKI